MNRELNAYSHGPTTEYDVRKVYEEHRDWNINPKSFLYGSVLVKMERVQSGLSFKFNIRWKNKWYNKKGWDWLPIVEWKYNRLIRWLCFWLWINWEYDWEVGEIIKDHLGELNDKP